MKEYVGIPSCQKCDLLDLHIVKQIYGRLPLLLIIVPQTVDNASFCGFFFFFFFSFQDLIVWIVVFISSDYFSSRELEVLSRFDKYRLESYLEIN